MIKASIIIPTRDRAKSLNQAIQSFIRQKYVSSEYEIIVVDNGSSDDTRKIADNAAGRHPKHNINYLYEPEPGLLSGRHRGALEAKGEILIFVDDDVESVPDWLPAIMEAFTDSTTVLAGGPSLPKFEAEPPAWLSKFWLKNNGQVTCGALSIAYLGDKKARVDPCHIWGLNFAIRKKILFDLGGFHPDCIPRNLQHFQGDGETGLGLKIKARGLKAIYAPAALVYHNIPRERLTVTSFEERFYYQGVCDSFTQIRKNGGLYNIVLPEYRSIRRDTSHLAPYDRYQQIICDRTHNAYVDGFLFHQKSVKNSQVLLDWVLRKDFLDYKLPDLGGNGVKKNIDSNDPIGVSTQCEGSIIRKEKDAGNFILIVGSAHRVGSTWLFQLLKDLSGFSSQHNLIPERFVQNSTLIFEDREVLDHLTKLKENFIFKSHSYPVSYPIPSNIKFVTILRDPRDVIVSNSFYLAYLEEIKGGWGRDFRECSNIDRIKRLIKEGEFILSRLERWNKNLNSYKVFYEKLIIDPVKELKAVSEFFGLRGDEEKLRSIIENNSFKSQTGRKPGEEAKKSTNRKGITGDWRNYFNPECIEDFKEAYNGRWNRLLLEMGYERYENWGPYKKVI